MKKNIFNSFVLFLFDWLPRTTPWRKCLGAEDLIQKYKVSVKVWTLTAERTNP